MPHLILLIVSCLALIRVNINIDTHVHRVCIGFAMTVWWICACFLLPQPRLLLPSELANKYDAVLWLLVQLHFPPRVSFRCIFSFISTIPFDYLSTHCSGLTLSMQIPLQSTIPYPTATIQQLTPLPLQAIFIKRTPSPEKLCGTEPKSKSTLKLSQLNARLKILLYVLLQLRVKVFEGKYGFCSNLPNETRKKSKNQPTILHFVGFMTNAWIFCFHLSFFSDWSRWRYEQRTKQIRRPFADKHSTEKWIEKRCTFSTIAVVLEMETFSNC